MGRSGELVTNLDVGDVVNYVRACTYAIGRLDKLPLCNRLLREIHQELLAGVRGQEESPFCEINV